jgi:hypothetical protein
VYPDLVDQPAPAPPPPVAPVDPNVGLRLDVKA